MSIRASSITAVLWSAADIFTRRGLGFLFTIGMARLLTPEEFGTVALLSIFVGIAGVFVDGGFSGALIQKSDATHIDESTVFWFNMSMGGAATIALWSFSPTIAAFFGDDILVPITQVLAINLFVGSLGSIHTTLLTKRLNFKIQTKVGLFSTAISGSIGILLAWSGCGVWSIVLQMLSATILSSVLYWLLNSWRPLPIFRLDSVRRLFGFGSYLFLSGILYTLYTRIYSILIGRLYGVRDLGLYSRADSLQQMSSGVISDVIGRVAFPAFSSISKDPVKLGKGVKLAVKGAMLINIPAMLGCMAVSDQLINVLFGQQWSSSAPIFRVLCISAVFLPLHVINLNFLKALGHSKIFFKLELLKNVLGISLLIVGSYFGVIGIAWGSVCYSVLAFLINAHFTGRFLDYGPFKQFIDIAPTIVVSVFMVISLTVLEHFLNCSKILELLILVLSGVSVFFLGAIACRLDAFYQVLDFTKNGRAQGELD